MDGSCILFCKIEKKQMVLKYSKTWGKQGKVGFVGAFNGDRMYGNC